MRTAIMLFEREAFEKVLKSLDGSTVVKLSGLPEDARLFAIGYDAMSDLVGFHFESQSFADVPDGALIPELSVTIERIDEPTPIIVESRP